MTESDRQAAREADLTERARRIGLNEAVFRRVNEEISGVADSFGLTPQRLDLVCECGDAACIERIEVTIAAYERLRSDPTLFAVVPGHETAGGEDVVAEEKGYVVVRKHPGGEEQLARATDPRS